MADDQLDVVQHPTLGPLKFPKDMPFEERNASIERLEKTHVPTESQAAAHPPLAPNLSMRTSLEYYGKSMPRELQGRQPLASPVAPLASAFMSAPKFIGGLATQMGTSAAIDKYYPGHPMLRDVASLAMGALGTGAASQAEELSGGARDFLGSSLRNPNGKLKPSVRTISRIGGGLAGSAMGTGGTIVGGLAGPTLADAIIPNHPNPEGWSVKLPGRMPKSSLAVEPNVRSSGIATDEGGGLLSRSGRAWSAGDLASMPREQLAGEYAKELQKPVEAQDQEWLQALRLESQRNPKGLYSSSPAAIKGGGTLAVSPQK